MAINPTTSYPGRITAANAAYPYGSARDLTAPGDGTGTMLVSSWVNDLLGIIQSLLSEAGITPNNTSESVTNPQVLEAIKRTKEFRSTTEMITTEGLYNKELRYLVEYSTATEPGMGGGFFYWDSASTATHDGALVFQATGVATGRWLRLYKEELPVTVFSSYASAITLLAAETITLVIDRDELIDASYTHPTGIALRFVNYKKITIASGVIITNGLNVISAYKYPWAILSHAVGDGPVVKSGSTDRLQISFYPVVMDGSFSVRGRSEFAVNIYSGSAAGTLTITDVDDDTMIWVRNSTAYNCTFQGYTILPGQCLQFIHDSALSPTWLHVGGSVNAASEIYGALPLANMTAHVHNGIQRSKIDLTAAAQVQGVLPYVLQYSSCVEFSIELKGLSTTRTLDFLGMLSDADATGAFAGGMPQFAQVLLVGNTGPWAVGTETYLLAEPGEVPVAFQPYADVYLPVVVVDNSVNVAGTMVWRTDGSVEFFVGIATAFTASGNKGVRSVNLSYMVSY